ISNYLLLLRGRLLGRGLLRGGLLLRSGLLVGGLGGRGLLDRLRLLGLGFLDHVGALGRLDALGLVGLGFDLRGFLGLRSLLRRGLALADRDDAQQGHLLAVPGLAAVVVPAALLEDRDLLALRLGDDLGRDRDLAGLGERI